MSVPTQDTLSASELAEQYGWAQAVLNSSPELARLFREAVKGQWTPDRFAASLRSTKWYQGHSESWRQAETQRLSDPKTYEANIAQRMAEMQQQAAAMGASLNSKQLRWRAEQSYKLGWNSQQTQATLATYVRESNGHLKGAAGQAAQQLRELAYANGVRYNDTWYTRAAQGVVAGTRSIADWEMDIRKQAASAFPTFREQIEAGQNVADIANPYRQTMSALLEVPDTDIDLFDPKIRSALSGRDPKTGQATAKSLWEFENELRKDPRWLKTNGAREQLTSVTQGVLDAFGFRG